MKRKISLLICFALIISLMAGCGSDKDPYEPTGDGLGSVDAPQSAKPQDQSLTLTYYREMTLNPLECTDYTNRVLISLLYQGLFTVDREYQVTPVLCKNYRISADNKTYVFYLENATFSDGSALTVQDAVASLQAAKESLYYGGRFFHITEIAESEDGGVLVRTDTPFENLPLLLDIPIIRQSQLENMRPVGTGPYYLDESAEIARLRRVQNWWCKASMVITAPSITLLEAESNNQIRDNFQFGGVDVVCADPGSDRFADYRCDYELWSCENAMFLYLACSADSEVFDNQALRTALTFAIDRDRLASEYYRGYAQGVSLPTSPQSPYYNQSLAAKYSYDSVRFATVVQEQNMVGKEVVLLVNSGDSLRLRVAQAIADMMTEGGLKVTLSKLSGSKYTYAVQTRQYDLYLGQTILSPNMDLSAFFHTYGALSYGGINNVTAYSLCLESLANYGNYYTLYKYIMENGLLCPVLMRSYAVFATRGIVTDLAPARDNVFYYNLGKTMEQALLREED